MPRREVTCPICGQLTNRPPQHLRIKHKVPDEDIPALVQQARQKKMSVSTEEIFRLLPDQQHITKKDLLHVVECLGITIDYQVSENLSSLLISHCCSYFTQ